MINSRSKQRTLCRKEIHIMKNIINGNQIKINHLELPASGIIPTEAVLKNVRPSYAKDKDGKKTELIESVKYDCVNMENFSSFTVKVLSSQQVITKEALEASDELVCIKIPVEETVIRPYEIAFGVAKVTVLAPYVKLSE